MSNQQATPTPWSLIVKHDKYGFEKLIGRDNKDGTHQVICGAIFSDEDAAFIVKAVNHFQLLVDAFSVIMNANSLEEAKRHAAQTLRNVQEGKSN